MAKQVTVKPNEIPEGWSLEAVDFVNRVNSTLFYFKLNYSFCKESLLTD